MLDDVRTRLRCPVCGAGFDADPATLRCPSGHSFDLARQGYANLLTRAAPARTETPEMVAARHDWLSAGHYDFITRAVATAVTEASPTADSTPGLVLDVGAGTGHYLAAVLDAVTHHHGLGIDLAKPAVRRCARAHPRAAAVISDVWRSFPLADRSCDVVLNVFAPRNPGEFHRVLRPDGVLIVVIPQAHHLGELVRAAGLLAVDPDKDLRVDGALRRWFRLDRDDAYEHSLSLTHAQARTLVAMGPSAWHTRSSQAHARIDQSVEPIRVTAAVRVQVHRPIG